MSANTGEIDLAANQDETPVAVLTSGGLDSAILAAYLAQLRSHVQPIYMQSGLAWEKVELSWLRRYLQAIQPEYPGIQPLVVLQQPTRDLYGNHWSVTGMAVPDATTPDEAVYLPGRNALLTLKALLWCHLHGVNDLALGVLASNPFPDATPAFFAAFTHTVGLAVANSNLRIITPFASKHKDEVMRLGEGLPLELSFSCIQPRDELHCGGCNKCHERREAFAGTGMEDRTEYWM